MFANTIDLQQDLMTGDRIFSRHSLKRLSQRGISKSIVQMVVANGNVIFKQGLKFYYVTKKQMKYFGPAIQKELNNLVVIMSLDNTVITCYKNRNAVKRVKHKSKRLSKY
jgi:hypothetical protein